MTVEQGRKEGRTGFSAFGGLCLRRPPTACDASGFGIVDTPLSVVDWFGWVNGDCCRSLLLF